MNYSIRRVQLSDMSELVKLIDTVFDERRTESQLQGKIFPFHFTGKAISAVAIDEQANVIAFWGLFPTTVILEGQKRWVAQVGDVAIHPQYRKGFQLFCELGKQVEDFAQEEDIDFLYCFLYGRDNAYPLIHRYLDYDLGPQVNGYYIKVNTYPSIYLRNIIGIRRLHAFFTSLLVRCMTRKGELEGTWERREGIQILRSAQYLDYKNTHSQIWIRSVGGNQLFLKHNKDGSLGVGDLLLDDDLQQVMKKIKRLAFCVGSRIIHFEFSKTHENDPFFARFFPAVQKRALLTKHLQSERDYTDLAYSFLDTDTY